MADIKEYLTIAQAAERLGVSRQAVLKAIKAGRIKAVAIDAGNRTSFYLIPKKELKKIR